MDVAFEAKACKKPKKKNNGGKPPSPPYQPWFDDSCHVEKRKYFMLKNRLRRSENKAVANKCSKSFKRFLSNKRKEFYKELNAKLKLLKNSNPREYWKILNGSVEGKKVKEKISLEVFHEHFKKLSDTKPSVNHEQPDQPSANPLLNDPITMKELHDFLDGSKNGKASGPDHIKNEYLKQLPEEGLNFVLKFFNKILESGIIPEDWTIGAILPLFKNKGSPEDPSNYRGITLLSCLGKLFTAILNGRINKFMNENGYLGNEQAGFRSGQSTMDHVFVLHHILDYYRQRGKAIYCAFVDYSKAFDLINRSALWCKLINHGVSGKILTVIQNMYQGAKSCVRANGKLSGFFKCTAGVRQGENLSPILFAIYLNDFQQFLAERMDGLRDLNSCLEEYDMFAKLCVLLYADDTVILAESEPDLQCALDGLAEYCKLWDLTVNLDKTKVVIFSQGRKKPKKPFLYLGEEVKVVDDYIYLGVIFNYNGSFKKAIENQKAVGLRAMQALFSKIRILALDVDTSMELFQRCVMPILLYGSEIWAFDSSNVASLEVLYRGFLKQLLHLYKATPTCMVLGETGQPKLNDLAFFRQLGFWAKLAIDEVSRLSKHFLPLVSALHSLPTEENSDKVFHFKWFENIKHNLDSLGLSYILHTPSSFSHQQIVSAVKLRTADVNRQTWHQEVMENPHCTNYRMFKSSPDPSPYLTLLPSSQRTILCKFRTRCHNLPICAQRFNKNVPESHKKCPLCDSSDVGDEFHYIFKCRALSSDREKLIPRKFTDVPNSIKFHELFESADLKTLSNLTKFVSKTIELFEYEKIESPIKLRASHTTRAGRISKPPSRLQIE